MRVTRVERGGPADEAGVAAGDELLSVDGREVTDALDLTFALDWLDEPETVFEFSRGGRRSSVTLPTARPEELGFEVGEPSTRTCGNACVFCFVDQLPGGLRKSLYVKDEDYRLSFSYGNYITLTNLSESDFERIAEFRLSPLYVSVHATDDDVRRRLLGSEDAPPILGSLRRLGEAGIRVHTQVVLVPGINDGEVLEDTLEHLHELGDTVESVAVVPVGLTEHRSGLPEIAPLTTEGARRALDAVDRYAERHAGDGPAGTICADEIYLLAGRPLPSHDDYGDFPQLENGVGLLRAFERDLVDRAKELPDLGGRSLAVALVTGELAAPFIEGVLSETLAKREGLSLEVIASPNTLFGRSVTVAGLVPGVDMVEALLRARDPDLALLPAAAFNVDGVTLDGMTAEEIASSAGRTVVVTDDLVGAVAAALERPR